MNEDIIRTAWAVIEGHTSGRKNRLDRHLCDSCHENIDDLRKALLAANITCPDNLYE